MIRVAHAPSIVAPVGHHVSPADLQTARKLSSTLAPLLAAIGFAPPLPPGSAPRKSGDQWRSATGDPLISVRMCAQTWALVNPKRNELYTTFTGDPSGRTSTTAPIALPDHVRFTSRLYSVADVKELTRAAAKAGPR